MRYFTVRKDSLVTRFGTGTYLGATIGIEQTGPNKGQTKIDWTPGEVVSLGDAELQQYAREYGQLEEEGALVPADEAAYSAYTSSQHRANGEQEDAAARAQRLTSAKEAAVRLAGEAEAAKVKADQAKADADHLVHEMEAQDKAFAVAKPTPTMQSEAALADARGRTPEAAAELAKQTAAGQTNPKAAAARLKE